MKVLQINCVYKKGSTGKIVYDIHNCLLSANIDSVVCYGRGSLIQESKVFKFCSEFESKLYHLFNKFGWLMYAVCPIATLNLIRIIKEQKPDVVHIHCINGYCVDIFKLLKFLGKSHIKTIVTHHAEFFYTGNCGHAYDCVKFQSDQGCQKCTILDEAAGTKLFDRTRQSWQSMKKAFSYFEKADLLFTAVSPWVVGRSLLSPICNFYQCCYVPNGVNTDVFKPSSLEDITDIKNSLPKFAGKLILHVTASFTTSPNALKGGYYINKLAKSMPDSLFVVVSTNVGSIQNLSDNVYIWGAAKSQEELATLYSAADLTVITSKRETFSMIVAESLCCGTPVVGFKAGGPESISIPEYSSFVEYGDVNELKVIVEHMLENKYDMNDISYSARNRYSKEVMATGYIDLYRQMHLTDILDK